MDNLLTLAERLLARSSRLSERQAYLLHRLHAKLVQRGRWLLGIFVVLIVTGMLAVFLGNDPLVRSLGTLLGLGAMVGLLWFIYTDKNNVIYYRLRVEERQLAQDIVDAKGQKLMRAAGKLKRRLIPGGMTRWICLLMVGLAFVYQAIYWFFQIQTTAMRWSNIGVGVLFLGIIYHSVKTLLRQISEYQGRITDDHRYLFLLPYRWKYVYELALLYEHAQFSAFEKKKIKALYQAFDDRPHRLYAEVYSWCWHLRFDPNRGGINENFLPYGDPELKVITNQVV